MLGASWRARAWCPPASCCPRVSWWHPRGSEDRWMKDQRAAPVALKLGAEACSLWVRAARVAGAGAPLASVVRVGERRVAAPSPRARRKRSSSCWQKAMPDSSETALRTARPGSRACWQKEQGPLPRSPLPVQASNGRSRQLRDPRPVPPAVTSLVRFIACDGSARGVDYPERMTVADPREWGSATVSVSFGLRARWRNRQRLRACPWQNRRRRGPRRSAWC